MSNFLKVGQPSLHFVLWLVQKTTGVMLLVEAQTPHSGTWSHISLLFGDLDRTVTTFLKVHFYYLYVNNLFYKRNSSWDLKKKKNQSNKILWIAYGINGLLRVYRFPVTQWGGFLHLTWSFFFSLWFPLCLYLPFILIEICFQTIILLASWWLYLYVIVIKEAKRNWLPFILLSWKIFSEVPCLLFVIMSITY